jgi:hypothetical protein
MDTTYLKITNLLLFFSLLYFYFQSKKNIYECILAFMLLLIIICSQLFWSNPIQNSFIHIIDALVAKVTIICFVIYIFFFKKKTWLGIPSAIIILSCICSSFYLSNLYSTEEWCSEIHIVFHGIMHLFCFIGTFFAFY